MFTQRLNEPQDTASIADIVERFAARHHFSLMLGLVLIAIAMRGLYFHDFRLSPYYDNLLVDAIQYDQQGYDIAQGNWVRGEVFYQDPLYPYFLGAVYSLAGHSPMVVYLIQALLGAVLCLLVAKLGLRVFSKSPHKHAIALIAGLLSALSTSFVYYDFLLIKTSLGLFLTVAHLLAIVVLADRFATERSAIAHRGTLIIGALGTGILLGFNLLTRGNYILLAPVFALWLAWRFWPKRGRQTAILVVSLYTLGTLFTILPVTAHNYAVSGEFVLITAQGGANFFIGNNSVNATGSYSVPQSIRPNPEHERHDFRSLAERETGRSLSWRETDQYLFAKALKWIRENPSSALAHHVEKWQLWFSGFEVADNYSFEFMGDNFAGVLKTPFASGYVIGTLGWTALFLVFAIYRHRFATILSLAGNPSLVLLTAFLLAYSISVTLFFVFGRYRIPIYPVLTILSAAFLVWLSCCWRKLCWRWRAITIAVLTFVSVIVCRPLWQPDWPSIRGISYGTQYFNLGAIYANNGERGRAIEHFDRAVPLLGDNTIALKQIADFYWTTGLIEKAQVVVQEIVEINPKDADAWYSLGFFAVNRQDLDTAERAFSQVVKLLEPIGVYGAPGRSPPHLVLGDIFAAKQQLDDARAMYRVFFERASRDEIYAHHSYRRAALILLRSPDLDDFLVGLKALSAGPQLTPESPWLDSLAELSLPTDWKAAALQVLDNQRESNLVDDMLRARILSVLGVEDVNAVNEN